MTLPDRLSVNPKSPFYNAELLERGVGIRFNGADKNNVEEYCVSEGWVRLAVGKTVDRHGNTSAASIPLAWDRGVRDGRIKPGQLLLLEAMGGGFTWGACVVRL